MERRIGNADSIGTKNYFCNSFIATNDPIVYIMYAVFDLDHIGTAFKGILANRSNAAVARDDARIAAGDERLARRFNNAVADAMVDGISFRNSQV